MRVLVIDGANVVGSRPDGWWKDRAGAAERLKEQLGSADLADEEVILVLEGAARRGSRPGTDRGVRAVHAAGSGDDAILETVLAQRALGDEREIVVVTADRGLRARVEAAGATCHGPSWLLAQL